MENMGFVYKISMVLLLVTAIGFGLTDLGIGQTERNPVLEFCTGTWCPWCTCGDATANEILTAVPNAIILAYHGPSHYSDLDPFVTFGGNSILDDFSFSAYPTGVVDRVSGIVKYYDGGWANSMNERASVPATVSINLTDLSYDSDTRNFNATFDFTALENLSGQFNFSVILVENEIIWEQYSNNTCTPGTSYHPNYVHEWLVRDMVNGSIGAMVSSGAWDKEAVITKSVTRTVPVPNLPAPDINSDNCKIVVIVYKLGSVLAINSEIQQAEQWPLTEPTSVESKPAVVETFQLRPNYPNPFNPETRISYDLPTIAGQRLVSLAIYNQLGQKVRELVNRTQGEGTYEVIWNGCDDRGRAVVSGVYFYTLKYGQHQKTRKLVLLR